MSRWSSHIDSLRADVIYAGRKLIQTKVTSSAAIFSLALAMGACIAAFRLMDALLLHPLPVAHTERLYTVAFRSPNALDGRLMTYDSNSYPAFLRMKTAAEGAAQLMAVSYADRTDLTYGSDDDMEKAFRQFVSGDMFTIFGLKPALGRLLSAADDVAPGAHPVAVISYDYWKSRFGGDPRAIGRTFRMGDGLYQIIGVSPDGFTGTEIGTPIDIFLPMMMKNASTLASSNNFWLRVLVQLDVGISPAPVRDRLAATYQVIQVERSKDVTLTPPQRTALFNETLLLEGAAAGRSNLQRDYGPSLKALAFLVGLVLLIACANLTNLMAARATARSREMALRISIGASRARLVQLVLAESAWIAGLATVLASILAWWSAPFVVQMINSAENPVRLSLGFDFRLLAFLLGLSLAVTFLFGLPSALRVSSTKPSAVLKAGGGPPGRVRLMHALIAAQIAFCFLVLFVAGLFVNSFDRLSRQPLGYSPERIVNLEALTRRPQPPVYWDQVAEHLRDVAGVASVAISSWPLMSGETGISAVSFRGGSASEVFADRFAVSPGWFEEMRIPILSGRDFQPGDARPGVAIVNQAFARQYFSDEDPLGKSFDVLGSRSSAAPMQIIGIVADVRYRDNLRIPIRPMFFTPFRTVTAQGDPQPLARGTFVIRSTAGTDPLRLAALLRKEVPRVRPEFLVSNIRTQSEIVASKTIRERLLSVLALFFAGVAILLAAVGLYGVLDYSVLQQRREIGIRIAIGARNQDVMRHVTSATFKALLFGGVAGLAFSIVSVRYIETILYHVTVTEPTILVLPVLAIVLAAIVAALPSVLRALRVDPVEMLRAD